MPESDSISTLRNDLKKLTHANPVDLKGRRIGGAADASAATEYVTLRQAENRYAAKSHEHADLAAVLDKKIIRMGVYAARGAASTYPNSIFIATDRGYVSWASNGTNWYYHGGVHVAAIANRPTDLGSTDAGYPFWATDSNGRTVWVWDGSAWYTVLRQEVADAATNTVTDVRVASHTTSGTAAASFGLRDLFRLENAGGAETDAGGAEIIWTTATASSESADWVWKLKAAGAAIAEKLRLISSGILQLVGAYFRSGDTTSLGSESRFGYGAFAAGVHGCGTFTNHPIGFYSNNTLAAYIDTSQVLQTGVINLASGAVIRVNTTQVVTSQQAAVADAGAVSGTSTSSAPGPCFGFASAAEFNQAITDINGIKTQLNTLLAKLRTHGLIAT